MFMRVRSGSRFGHLTGTTAKTALQLHLGCSGAASLCKSLIFHLFRDLNGYSTVLNDKVQV